MHLTPPEILRSWLDRDGIFADLSSKAEFVLVMNGAVSLGAGLAAWIWTPLTFAWAAAGALVLFVALFACMLYPRTARVPALLGTLMSGALLGAAGASFGFKYFGTSGAWLLGAAAALAGLWAGASAYRDSSALQTPEPGAR
jgi:hypothetical protein